ncbi:capsule assembly Wzi family protein [Dyadobacter psychrotolerans]|uniref:Capsule assembly Wzi family protein n=1 Tax=Dyadobacter psychrotolerans TaxID=2541721 RepID=A0A4R5DMC1_9BACT|nr:capsule assembly Wzi family protein [Dyadobacter psychrotolerans]TDE15412.1 hypothetical protein E0F88_12940 [Dyadobacter psychrotolerans]
MRPSPLTIFICLIFLFPFSCFSQPAYLPNQPRDSSFHFTQLQYFASTRQTPFWMQANQFGIVPQKNPAALLHLGVEHFTDIFNKFRKVKNLRIGGGIEAAISFPNAKIRLPQLFGSIRLKNWEFFIGRKKQSVGLADSTIGMGSYVWSGNAMPIPKLQAGTSGFITIPLTRNWIAFSGFYSDGFFENKRSITSGLKLHQKALYLRLGRLDSRLKLYGGFNHQAQWGGRSPYHSIDDKLPDGLRNYFNVVTGKAHVKSGKITNFDSTNRIGNHLGTIDLAVEVETFSSSIFLYRQNVYEDGSLYHLNNISDGLNGIRFRRKNLYSDVFSIQEVVVEFLNTKSQGGSIANVGSYVRGKDDYFNNAQIRDGWSYYDRTIGTPFIPPTSATKWNWPVNADFLTSNNRVSVWHLGVSGECLKNINWTTKFSYSDNAGTYNVNFESSAKQFSGLLAFQLPLNILGKNYVKLFRCCRSGKALSKNVWICTWNQKKPTSWIFSEINRPQNWPGF